jgi:hypothetical protein
MTTSVRDVRSQQQHYKENEHEGDVEPHPADAERRDQSPERCEDRFRDAIDDADDRIEPLRRARECNDPRQDPCRDEEPEEDVDDEVRDLSDR